LIEKNFKPIMKKQKRILILTGAGSAYPWFKDGIKVTTNAITSEIIKDPFCKTIYDELQKQYAPEFRDSINFETIINAIERVFLYYRGRQDHFDSDFSALFCPEDVIQKKFPLREGHEDKNQTAVDIAELFEQLINTISRLISQYDEQLKSGENKMNSKLCKFLELIRSEKNCIRSYTTNYDQMFIDVTKESANKLSFFDGFDAKTNGYDLERILDSDLEDCYFNLHGSIYWENSELSIPIGYRMVKVDIPFNDNFNPQRFRVKESNPNEPFIESPIITGFNKLQRINQEPFNAFANAFYRDCHKADFFIFIGFSFNDSHINNVLSNVDWNRKKVLIIDNKKDKRFKGIQYFDVWCNESIEPDLINKERKVNLYNKGFEKFLKEFPKILIECGIEL
jgi:hypothetical protein